MQVYRISGAKLSTIILPSSQSNSLYLPITNPPIQVDYNTMCYVLPWNEEILSYFILYNVSLEIIQEIF